MSGSAVVRNGQDAWVGQNIPSQNRSAVVNIQVGGPAGQVAYGYIYFQNPAPARATIERATLRLRGRYENWGSVTINVQRIASAVKFGQLNWNNRPGVQGGVASLTQGNPHPRWWEIDVTPQIQAMTNRTVSNFGFRISTPSTVRRFFFSLDAANNRPTLEVVWNDNPQRPTQLNPSGGQIVSVSHPTLEFDYTDVGGNTELDAVHVQIAQSDRPWSNPNWNSGVVPATEPELDLSQTNYGGLNPDMTRNWRVRVRDGAGLWSRWSHTANGNGARMTRRTKGTLTMTNPPPGTPSVINDLTPPINWTFTGRTQKDWRIIICDPNDVSNEFYNTGWRTSETTRSHTIPNGILRRFGYTYRLFLDVRDTLDRVATPGDLPRVRVSRNFVVQESATVAPVTNLEGAFDEARRPYMTLTWERASAPDRFNVLRNGIVIAGAVPSGNLQIAPGRFRYVDKDADQNREHTWRVQAIVNGVTSSNNPGFTATLRSVHAWLVERNTDRLVCILNPEISFEMPEIAGTYEPIQRERVVRVVQQQRGVQGSVSGQLVTIPGISKDASERDLVWMKRRPTQVVRLMVGNRTWRVLLGDVTMAPAPFPNDEMVDVSFSFWSLDGPPVNPL